jgi:hypothetical protein
MDLPRGLPEFRVLKTRVPAGQKPIRVQVNGTLCPEPDWQPETGRLIIDVAGALPARGRPLTLSIELAPHP